MADTRQRTTWGSRFRFLVRAAGLTGVAAVAAGGMLAAATLPTVEFGSWAAVKAVPDVLRAAGDGAYGELAKVGAWALACGVAAVLIALAVEVLGGLLLGVGRRTAAGTTATVGIVAAVALLVIVNLYSFTHYGRYDCTRDRRFTLKPELAAELGKLRATSPTTIVVHQTHNFGSLSPTRDSYTKAAEAEVAAKVKDLVDQFREFGPQFRVVVLDTEAFEYRTELAELTKDSPELKAALAAAPENSIFFHANKRVQRLSFSEFMQLDRAASEEADGGRANLVLLPQGIDTFARRVLEVQERRPKAAVCVVHELLTTAADDPENRFSLAGLKKSLAAQGFDVVDIVLKKNWSGARSMTDLKPAADSREESKLERLEGEVDDADAEVASARAEVRQFETILGLVAKLKDRPWEERKAFYLRLTRQTLTEDREPEVLAMLDKRLKRAQDELDDASRKKVEAEKKLAEALKDERPLQDRRITDVSAKLTKQLADVDLLVVPRFTTEDAMKGPGVDATLHALSKEQVKVAKEFMKRGKPVLACLGPITPQVGPQQPGESLEDFDKRVAAEIGGAADVFERLLAERGVELGRSVILFDGETRALAGGDPFAGGRPTEVPPVALAEPPADAAIKPNPVASAFRLTARVAEQKLDIRLRAVRPVGLAPGWQAKQPFAAELAFTTGESWNELQPYPRFGRRPDGSRALAYAPKYEPVDLTDPKKGARDEERRGPFAVAVAVENKVPAAWFDEEYERRQAVAALYAPFDGTFAAGLAVAADKLDRPAQRTVVFGSGTVFSGAELKPPQEKLLLHTVNWLTVREDRLPKPATAETPEWHYPRVAMSDRDRTLWRLGTAVGLPLVAAYAGLLAMMRRRMR